MRFAIATRLKTLISRLSLGKGYGLICLILTTHFNRNFGYLVAGLQYFLVAFLNHFVSGISDFVRFSMKSVSRVSGPFFRIEARTSLFIFTLAYHTSSPTSSQWDTMMNSEVPQSHLLLNSEQNAPYMEGVCLLLHTSVLK